MSYIPLYLDSRILGSNPDPSEHKRCTGDLHEGKSQVQGIGKRHRMEVSGPKSFFFPEDL